MHERIESVPDVMLGKPVIRGTRITVEHLVRALAAGETFEDLLREYPQLAIEDIRAALDFAADSLSPAFVFPMRRPAR